MLTAFWLRSWLSVFLDWLTRFTFLGHGLIPVPGTLHFTICRNVVITIWGIYRCVTSILSKYRYRYHLPWHCNMMLGHMMLGHDNTEFGNFTDWFTNYPISWLFGIHRLHHTRADIVLADLWSPAPNNNQGYWDCWRCLERHQSGYSFHSSYIWSCMWKVK